MVSDLARCDAAQVDAVCVLGQAGSWSSTIRMVLHHGHQPAKLASASRNPREIGATSARRRVVRPRVPFSYGEASRDHWVNANGCSMETVRPPSVAAPGP